MNFFWIPKRFEGRKRLREPEDEPGGGSGGQMPLIPDVLEREGS